MFLKRVVGQPSSASRRSAVRPFPPLTRCHKHSTEYFAEELYQAADPDFRWGLCQLAVPPSLDVDLASRLLGSTGPETIFLERAVNLGVLNPDQGRFEMHPLLRRFLRDET